MTDEEDIRSKAIADLADTLKRAQQASIKARADLIAATPILVTAIRNRSGQSFKVEEILWSLWNDENPVNLADALSSLDYDITVAVLTLITARAYLSGDADDLLEEIIKQSGSQPPKVS